MVQLGRLALRFLSGRLSCSWGEQGGETVARAEGVGREGGADEEGWLGGTVECLETSCSFDLLVSPVAVASSACLTGLQLSSVLSIVSGLPGFTTLQDLSSLSTVSPNLLSSGFCLSGLSLSLFFSAFPLSIFNSSLHVSSVLCPSSFALPCFDFPPFTFTFFFFLSPSFLPSLFALSASNLSRFDFLSFRFSFFAFLSLSLFFASGGS